MSAITIKNKMDKKCMKILTSFPYSNQSDIISYHLKNKFLIKKVPSRESIRYIILKSGHKWNKLSFKILIYCFLDGKIHEELQTDAQTLAMDKICDNTQVVGDIAL